ncbi:MAG: BrnT family toxin [Dysgonamonadaceae bacterium]|jgi:uncharacterized DUF497 family protein|nr:BrnT family toxin [Dysgonamonadaceae bacterium]
MTFEWDETKNAENIAKHNVSFEEAQDAFYDENAIINEDEEHSLSEERYFCIGKTRKDILTVRFTYRNGNIRIIGAGYWRKQKKYYEKENNLY